LGRYSSADYSAHSYTDSDSGCSSVPAQSDQPAKTSPASDHKYARSCGRVDSANTMEVFYFLYPTFGCQNSSLLDPQEKKK